VSTGGGVSMAGRAFVLGAVYAPAPHVRPYQQRARECGMRHRLYRGERARRASGLRRRRVM